MKCRPFCPEPDEVLIQLIAARAGFDAGVDITLPVDFSALAGAGIPKRDPAEELHRRAAAEHDRELCPTEVVRMEDAASRVQRMRTQIKPARLAPGLKEADKWCFFTQGSEFEAASLSQAPGT